MPRRSPRLQERLELYLANLPPLFRLPLELRILIYTFVFATKARTVALSQWQLPLITYPKPTSLKILLVNRQIYNEASSVLYHVLGFYVDDITLAIRFFSGVRKANLARIRSLEIGVELYGDWKQRHWAGLFTKHKTSFPGLRRLELSGPYIFDWYYVPNELSTELAAAIRELFERNLKLTTFRPIIRLNYFRKVDRLAFSQSWSVKVRENPIIDFQKLKASLRKGQAIPWQAFDNVGGGMYRRSTCSMF